MDSTLTRYEETTRSPSGDSTEVPISDENTGPQTVMAAVLLAVGSLAVVGNAFVLIVLLGTKRLRKMLPNLLIINQSLIDLTAGLLLIVRTACGFAFGYDIQPKGIAAELYCKFGYGMGFVWGTMKASTYNLIAITIERYLMVVFPLKHKVAFTRNKALGMAVSTWVIGLVWEKATSIPFSVVEDGICVRSKGAFEEPYGFLSIIISFFIPLVVHPAMYAHMVAVLRKGKQKVFSISVTAASATSDNSNRQAPKRPGKLTRTQKNLFKTMAFVTVGFFLCWSGNQVYFLLYNLGFTLNPTTPFYFFTVAASNFNCGINPLVYLVMYKDFRKAARNVFSRGTRVEPIT